MDVLFGVFPVAIRLDAGLPAWWVAAEGSPFPSLGIVGELLNRPLAAGRR